jgi:hypothetical protein
MDKPDQITQLWLDEYVNNHLVCGLCGNSGKIITFVNTPSGEPCGGTFFCVCPNGRKLKSLGQPIVDARITAERRQREKEIREQNDGR